MSGISAVSPRPPLAGSVARVSGGASLQAPHSPISASAGARTAPARPGVDGPAPAQPQAGAIPESLSGRAADEPSRLTRLPLFEGRIAGPPPAFHSNLLDQRQDIRTLINELDQAREARSDRLEQERINLLLAPDSKEAQRS